MKISTILAGVIAGVVLAGAAAFAQDAGKKDAGAAMQMPKPAPELQKLSFLAGKWTGQETFEPNPMAPQGTKGTGTLTANFDLDNFFLHLELHSKSDMMNYSAHGLISYDAAKSQYVEYWFDNTGEVTQYTGKLDGDKFVLTGAVQAGKPSERVTFTKASPTQLKMVVEMDEGKGFAKFIEVNYTKQAGS
jgi:uncharacterized protein DUF1579